MKRNINGIPKWFHSAISDGPAACPSHKLQLATEGKISIQSEGSYLYPFYEAGAVMDCANFPVRAKP